MPDCESLSPSHVQSSCQPVDALLSLLPLLLQMLVVVLAVMVAAVVLRGVRRAETATKAHRGITRASMSTSRRRICFG